MSISVSTKRFILSYWLMQLWRLESPMIFACKLETQESQGYSTKVLEVESCGVGSSLILKAWEQGVLRAGKDWCSSSGSQAELVQPFSAFLFYSGPSVIWMMPTHTGEGHPLDSIHQFKCYYLLETLFQTHPEIMSNQLSGHPVAQPSGHTQSTFISGKSRYWHLVLDHI